MPTALCTPGTWYAGFSGDAPAIDPRTGNRIYGRTFQEAQQNARAAQNGGSIGPQPSWAGPPSREAAPARLSPTRRPAATATPDAEQFPAFDGLLSGIIVNEVFTSRFGPTLLECSGLCTGDFEGVPIVGTAVKLGDGYAELQVRGNRLRLLVCHPDVRPDSLDQARETSFEADWHGSEPDEWRVIDGQRVAVFNQGGWGLTAIDMVGREVGSRDFCLVR